jgi:hypothetical protein
MVGEAGLPEWLEIRQILAAFGETERQAAERYARFVAEGRNLPSPWERLKSQIFLGSDAFALAVHGISYAVSSWRAADVTQGAPAAAILGTLCSPSPGSRRGDRRRLRKRWLHPQGNWRLFPLARLAGKQDPPSTKAKASAHRGKRKELTPCFCAKPSTHCEKSSKTPLTSDRRSFLLAA